METWSLKQNITNVNRTSGQRNLWKGFYLRSIEGKDKGRKNR